MRRLVVIGILAVACGSASAARAEPVGNDAVIAQSLFDEGRKLLEAGKVKEACVKFAESQRLDPGGGTLLNLALCHEREGRIATASAELEAATAQAIKDQRTDREGIAREHFAALQPKIPRLIVDVHEAAPDEVVSIDGHALPRAAWGSATGLDPGDHDLEARAPGRKAITRKVRAEERKTQRVAIPTLEVDPHAQAPSPIAPQAQPGGGWPVVHLDADNPDATIEQLRLAVPWLAVCNGTCDRPLDPLYVYRVGGKGITPSAPFTVPSGVARVDVHATTGSAGKATTGGILFTLGVVGVAIGASFLLTSFILSDASGNKSTFQTVGVVGLVGGGALTAGGLVLALGSQTHAEVR